MLFELGHSLGFFDKQFNKPGGMDARAVVHVKLQNFIL